MTRDELKLRLQAHFENNSFYAQTDFNASIQDGYDEVVALSGVNLKSVIIPFVANKTYYDILTLIPDLIGVVAIFQSNIKRWLFPDSVRKFRSDRIDWDTAIGTPLYFSVISHRHMAIYKKPSVAGYGNMYVFYKAAAPTLSGSTSIIIPDDYGDALEDYCKKDLWEQGQEWSKAGLYFETYLEMLGELVKWVNSNRNPGKLNTLRDQIG